MPLSILISIVVAMSVLCLTGGLISLTRRDKSVSDRLDVYLATGDPSHVVTLKELELSKPFSERVIIPIAQRAARLFAWMLPQNRMNALRARLVMAGNPSGITAYQFAGVKGLVMTMVVGASLVFAYLTHYPATFLNLVLLGLFAFCSFSLPDFWLSRQITQRQTAIINALPDALDLLVIANDAGLSFEMAMQEITGKWDNDLAREFGRVLSDIRMGQPRRDALNSLGERTGVPDIISFVSAVNQAESMGVSIGRVLTVQAEELRVRRRQRAQERANQAPVKMMIPLVFLIFPSIFAVLLGPAVPELMRSFNGL
jgi:tight adherence protein C